MRVVVETSRRVDPEGVTPDRVQVHVEPDTTAVHGLTVDPGSDTESAETVRPAGTEPDTVTSAADPVPCSTTESIVDGVDRATVKGFAALSMVPHPVVCETETENVPSGKSAGSA